MGMLGFFSVVELVELVGFVFIVCMEVDVKLIFIVVKVNDWYFGFC